MKITLKDKYADRRRGAYQSLEDQMDALWHSMDGDESKRLEPFYSMIKSVKDGDPKPSAK